MNTAELWKFAAELIETPSETKLGTAAITETVSRWADHWKIPYRKHLALQTSIDGKQVPQENIFLGKRLDQNHYKLILQTHLDTVSWGRRDLWRTDPLKLTVDGDAVFGLGTADVKLDFAAKMWALFMAGCPEDILLMGTAAEETGMLGLRAFMKEKPVKADLVLVGEPSELNPMIGHKGYCAVEFRKKLFLRDSQALSQIQEFRGQSAHGSRPYEGKSALNPLRDFLVQHPQHSVKNLVVGDLINKVPDHGVLETGGPGVLAQELEKQFSEWERILKDFVGLQGDDRRFSPSSATYNVGIAKLDGDGTLIWGIDLRLLPGLSSQGATDRLKKALDPQTELKVLRANEPLLQSEDHDVFKKFKQIAEKHLKKNIQYQYKTTSTEAGIWHSLRNVPVLVFAPGRSENNSHCPNESNSRNQVENAAMIYYELMKELGA